MGFDISQLAYSGSYSMFHELRVRLAEMIGINLNEMDGYISQEAEERGDEGKSWWKYRHEPLTPFLAIPDCSGIIRLEHLAPMIFRMEELLAKLITITAKNNNVPVDHNLEFVTLLIEDKIKIEYKHNDEELIELLQTFIKGSKLAVLKGIGLEFNC